jgi:DNA replication protein
MQPSATGFIGFPDVKMKPVVIPDHFFTELLPQIDDLAELKLTLHCFWLLNEQPGELRYLRGEELRQDETLLRSLTLDNNLRPPQEALADALQRAVARNTLLKLEIETDLEDGGVESEGVGETIPHSPLPTPHSHLSDWYFINTVKGRQTLALIRQGKLKEVEAAIPDEARLRVQRPNVYVLYEQNIGLMTPLIADQLRDLEKSFPPAWVEEAFEIAVSRNKRHLRYIQNILKRWETEGKEGDRHEEPRRDVEGDRRRKYLPDEFSDVILG